MWLGSVRDAMLPLAEPSVAELPEASPPASAPMSLREMLESETAAVVVSDPDAPAEPAVPSAAWSPVPLQAISSEARSAGRRTFFISIPLKVEKTDKSSLPGDWAPGWLADLRRLACKALPHAAVRGYGREHAATRATGSIEDHASVGGKAG